MGRESRQSRRARERRQQQQREGQGQGSGPGRTRRGGRGPNWPILIGGGIIALVLILGIIGVGSGAFASPKSTPVPTSVPVARTYGGVQCGGATMSVTYHVHAHIVFNEAGKSVVPPAYAGMAINNNCTYWLHTHAESPGIIHIEAPHPMVPKLGAFLDIWKATRPDVSIPTAKPGQTTKVYVDLKPYHGNIRDIKLKPHTVITIDYGPPFPAPKPFPFAKYQL